MENKTVQGIVPIVYESKDFIQFGKENFYSEDYLKEMMRREYERGLKDGRQVVIHKAEVTRF